MAYDKAVDSGVLDAGLKLIADAIREKGGTEDTLAFPQAMADAIAAIEGGGGALVLSGEITLESDSKYPYFKFGQGVAPSFFVLIAKNQNDLLANALNGYTSFVMSGTLIQSANTSNYPYTAYRYGYNANTQSFAFICSNGVAGYRESWDEYAMSGVRPFKAGQTYVWIAVFE